MLDVHRRRSVAACTELVDSTGLPPAASLLQRSFLPNTNDGERAEFWPAPTPPSTSVVGVLDNIIYNILILLILLIFGELAP